MTCSRGVQTCLSAQLTLNSLPDGVLRLQIVVWVLVTIVQTLPLWHRLKSSQLEGEASC